jgi:hypothetical protein
MVIVIIGRTIYKSLNPESFLPDGSDEKTCPYAFTFEECVAQVSILFSFVTEIS